MLQPGPRYHWRKALLIIAFSVCCVFSIALITDYLCRWMTSKTFLIEALVHTSAERDFIPTSQLAEILNLSQDHPIELSQFDVDEGVQRLCAAHVIRKAHIKKMKPRFLYIDYEKRKPIAILGDFTNTLLDHEGVLFPFQPFYSPKKLPEVYLGSHTPSNPWGEKIAPRHMKIVIDVLNSFDKGVVDRIDLSQIEAASAGHRQLILILKQGTILRLTSKNYAKELDHYFILACWMKGRALPKVIDMRNPEVAYIEYGKSIHSDLLDMR